MSDQTHSILLTGLDGSNPLAFLAALGTLRTLTLALPQDVVRMSWEQHEGSWSPRVQCDVADSDAFIDTVDKQLRSAVARHAFSIGDNLNLSQDAFHEVLINAVEDANQFTDLIRRIDADFFAAFGSDAYADKDGIMEDTALRTMSGAGHQHFLKFFRELVGKTDAGHIRRSLFGRWDYADEGRGLNLRWDPADDRRYALRWEDPSGDPVKSMRGANRLAIEAMPMLPTIPTSRRLATTAFEGTGARATFFIWPIWSTPLTEPVIRSLLGQVGSLRDRIDERPRMGVIAMFSTARITTGKFRNFTPSKPV